MRQDFVLNQIQSGQVVITCCEKDRLTQLGQVLTIEAGRLMREDDGMYCPIGDDFQVRDSAIIGIFI